MDKENLLKEYGKEFFFFHHYYKYKFTYKLSLDSKNIFITFGGDSAEIYRLELTQGVTANLIDSLFDDWDFYIEDDKF